MRDAKEKLVLDNMRLAYKLALYYYRKFSGVYELDDLRSVSFIGLLNAANTFNNEFNYRFSTYAYACIKTEIRNYLRENRKFQNQMYLEDSLTSTYNDSDSIKLEDILADSFNLEEDIEGSIQVDTLLNEINKLPGRYPVILKYRMQGMTFAQIGGLLGVSQPTISTDYNRAINLLRIRLKDWR